MSCLLQPLIALLTSQKADAVHCTVSMLCCHPGVFGDICTATCRPAGCHVGLQALQVPAAEFACPAGCQYAAALRVDGLHCAQAWACKANIAGSETLHNAYMPECCCVISDMQAVTFLAACNQAAAAAAGCGLRHAFNGRACLWPSCHDRKHQVMHNCYPASIPTAVKASVLQLHRQHPVLTCQSCNVPSLHSTSSRPGD